MPTSNHLTRDEHARALSIAYKTVKNAGAYNFISSEELASELHLYALERIHKVKEWREHTQGFGRYTVTIQNQARKILFTYWRQAYPHLSATLGTPQRRKQMREMWDSLYSYKLQNEKTRDLLTAWYLEGKTITQIAEQFLLSTTTISRHIQEFEYDQLRRWRVEEHSSTSLNQDDETNHYQEEENN